MRHPSLIPLSQDHHHGLALALRCRKQALGQIKPMGDGGLRERANELILFYGRNLESHFQAEEEVLFPLLKSVVPESHSVIEQLLREHEQIRATISRLEGSAALGKIIFDLGDLLERHIRQEERELFPMFERHVDKAQAAAAGEQINAILENQPR